MLGEEEEEEEGGKKSFQYQATDVERVNLLGWFLESKCNGVFFLLQRASAKEINERRRMDKDFVLGDGV